MANRGPILNVWRKSLRSAEGECVEIAVSGRTILVRDSKNPDGPVLAFDRRRWSDFLRFVATGRH